MKTKKFIKRKVFQNENTLYRYSWADCLFWSYILTLIEILRCVTSSDCSIYRIDKTLLQSQYEHGFVLTTLATFSAFQRGPHRSIVWVFFCSICIKFMHTHIYMRIYIIHVIVQISLKMKNKWAFRMVNKPNENCTISENNKSNYNYAMVGMYWLRYTSEKNTEEHFENIKIFFNTYKFNLFCS